MICCDDDYIKHKPLQATTIDEAKKEIEQIVVKISLCMNILIFI